MSGAGEESSPLREFLAQYKRDLEEGVVRGLSAYQAMFPGDPAGIARVVMNLGGDSMEGMADPYSLGMAQGDVQPLPRRERRGSRADRVDALAALRSRLEELRLPAWEICLKPGAGRDLVDDRFGGSPYSEGGEEWPICRDCGLPMDFVCQLDLRACGELQLGHLGLMSFYYCWETMPAGSAASDDGAWEVRFHDKPNPERAVALRRPEGAEYRITRPCRVAFRPLVTLPDHNDIERWFPDVEALCRRLNHESPWLPYRTLVTAIVGERFPFRSRIGGWPTWSQFAPLAEGGPGQPQRLLVQIDSEVKANLDWYGGCVYLTIDPAHSRAVDLRLDFT